MGGRYQNSSAPAFPSDIKLVKDALPGGVRFSNKGHQALPQVLLRRNAFLKMSAEKMSRSAASSTKYREQDQRELIEILAQQGDGSVLRGWRRELDPDGLLEVDFPDFCHAARRLAWSGDAYLLFGEDQDYSSLTLSELSPPHAQLMDDFRQWVKEQFLGPVEMLRAIDESAGKVAREAFVSGCRSRGFQGDLEEIFNCCDPHDQGFVVPDSVLFLELDPKMKAQGLFSAKTRFMRDWKQKIAMDYMAATSVHPSAESPSIKHRLAPRPWQADIFEHLPVVACQRRKERCVDSYQRQQQALQLFSAHLRESWGHEVRALRRVLDPEGKFYVTQATLRHYCRKVRLSLRARDLWRALDRDGDGRVALEEFAVRPAVVLAQFQQWARASCGSCAAVWDSQEAIVARRRKSASGWMSDKKMLFGPFTETLRALGWPKAEDAGARSTLLSSLDAYGCSLIVREDLEWLDRWKYPEWLCAEPDPEAWAEIRGSLLRIYHHPLRAWRALLDKDSSNQISWLEFREACKKINFDGNIGGAWRQLDTDLSGTISMREYDPPSAELLESFKAWSEMAFGSVALCFKALDEDCSGFVTLPEFRRACTKMRWEGDVRLLFDCLDVDGKKTDKATGKRSISLEDLVFLDSWQVDPRLDEAPCCKPKEQELRRWLSDPCLASRGSESPGKGGTPSAKRRPVVVPPLTEVDAADDFVRPATSAACCRPRAAAVRSPEADLPRAQAANAAKRVASQTESVFYWVHRAGELQPA